VLAPAFASVLALVVHAAPTVLLAPIDAIGFDETEAPKVAAAVEAALKGTGHDVLAGPTVDDDCAADAACVREKLADRPLLRLTILRVGSEVDVKETLFGGDGAPLTSDARQQPADAFLQAPISAGAIAALTALVPAQVDQPPVEVASENVHPGILVASGGGIVAFASVVAFAAEAATLEDPTSLGGAKERARVTAWVFLGTFAVGAAAAAGGAVWAFMPTELSP